MNMNEYIVLKRKIFLMRERVLVRRFEQSFIYSSHQKQFAGNPAFSAICMKAGMTPEQKKKVFDSGDNIEITNEELGLMVKVFLYLEKWDLAKKPK